MKILCNILALFFLQVSGCSFDLLEHVEKELHLGRITSEKLVGQYFVVTENGPRAMQKKSGDPVDLKPGTIVIVTEIVRYPISYKGDITWIIKARPIVSDHASSVSIGEVYPLDGSISELWGVVPLPQILPDEGLRAIEETVPI